MKSFLKTVFQVWIVGAVVVAAIGIFSGSDSSATKTDNETVLYTVPSDPHGKYEFLRIKQTDNGNVLIVTKRYGKITEFDNDGISFTAREVNCKNGMFRYKGMGDTVEEMISNGKKDNSSFGPLTEESISSYVAGHGCAQFVKYRKDI
jgi:hypothetical protein